MRMQQSARQLLGPVHDMGEARGSQIALCGHLSTFSSAPLTTRVRRNQIRTNASVVPKCLGPHWTVPRKWNYSLPARHKHRLTAVLGTSTAQLLLYDRASTQGFGIGYPRHQLQGRPDLTVSRWSLYCRGDLVDSPRPAGS